ncbi:MAG: HAD family hydrolase [Patescibacteria group bacterium]
MFIVDFDDVLLDTMAYKESRIIALEKIGVTREVYNATYKQTYYNYTHEAHALALAEHEFSYDTVLHVLNECLHAVGQFIFSDTHDFLDFLKSYKEKIILLTIGISEIQEFKVDAAGIRKYFDEIVTTIEPKEKVILELNSEIKNNSWFFEDKVKETLSVRRAFPQLNIVLRQGSHIPEIEYEQSGLPYFKTLTEIKNYVREQYAK